MRKNLSALIPAAGDGERLGLGPKGNILLGGRPLIIWLSQKLLQFADELIVAVSEENEAFVASSLSSHGVAARIIIGGSTRQETVALLVEKAEYDYVLIHNVACPFASAALIEQVCSEARNHGAAAAYLYPDVPVGVIENDMLVTHQERGAIGLVQAPQAYKRLQLLDVIRQAEVNGIRKQSTSELWQHFNLPLRAVPGEKTNLKLTTQHDLLMAQSLVEFLSQ